MSRIIVLGAGVIGLSTAMMLRAGGHDVTVFHDGDVIEIADFRLSCQFGTQPYDPRWGDRAYLDTAC